MDIFWIYDLCFIHFFMWGEITIGVIAYNLNFYFIFWSCWIVSYIMYCILQAIIAGDRTSQRVNYHAFFFFRKCRDKVQINNISECTVTCFKCYYSTSKRFLKKWNTVMSYCLCTASLITFYCRRYQLKMNAIKLYVMFYFAGGTTHYNYFDLFFIHKKQLL